MIESIDATNERLKRCENCGYKEMREIMISTGGILESSGLGFQPVCTADKHWSRCVLLAICPLTILKKDE